MLGQKRPNGKGNREKPPTSFFSHQSTREASLLDGWRQPMGWRAGFVLHWIKGSWLGFGHCFWNLHCIICPLSYLEYHLCNTSERKELNTRGESCHGIKLEGNGYNMSFGARHTWAWIPFLLTSCDQVISLKFSQAMCHYLSNEYGNLPQCNCEKEINHLKWLAQYIVDNKNNKWL